MSSIIESKFVCPYHKNEIFSNLDQLNIHMSNYHWKGLDFHLKPDGDDSII